MRIQVLALCSISLVGCQPSYTDAPVAPALLEGDFAVSYMLQTSDTTSGGNSGWRAKRIAFHEGYVVVVEEEGGGRVLPIDRLIRFDWRAVK